MGGGKVVVDNEDQSGEVDWSQLEGLGGEEGLPVGTVISPDMLAKRLLWDVTPCDLAERVRDYLGYSPASEDVEEMEHKESHQRLAQVIVIAPYVDAMAGHTARAIAGAMIVESGDTPPDAVRDETIEKLEPVIFHAAVGILAELIDVGLVHLPHYGFVTFGPDEVAEAGE
jgi:hypothetical protein